MSLVVYNPSHEVVVADPEGHAVVFNPSTQQLEKIRAEVPFRCPRCGFPDSREPLINHNYFRVLRKGLVGGSSSLPRSIFTSDYFSLFFTVLSKLGAGANGVVFQVNHHLFDYPLGTYAVKQIPLVDDVEYLHQCLHEVRLVYELSLPNLVKYFHVWLEVAADSLRLGVSGEMPMCYILMEYCKGGDLESVMAALHAPAVDIASEKRRRRASRSGRPVARPRSRLLNPVEVVKFFGDIARGVEELHRHKVLHRDLKPSNCLLDEAYGAETYAQIQESCSLLREVAALLPSIKVSDFGETQFEGQKRRATGATGTAEYTAPELRVPQDGVWLEYSKESDVYLLGVVLAEMCYGSGFWGGRGGGCGVVDLPMLEQWVAEGNAERAAAGGDPVPAELGRLMVEMLGRKEGRPGIDQVVGRVQAVLETLVELPVSRATAPVLPAPTKAWLVLVFQIAVVETINYFVPSTMVRPWGYLVAGVTHTNRSLAAAVLFPALASALASTLAAWL